MINKKLKDALELVGILGIIGSLILVASELRQNTRIASAQATFLINTSLDGAYRAMGQNLELMALLAKGDDAPETLTAIERQQFITWRHADLNTSEALWFFYRNGLIQDQDFDGFAVSICSRLITPGGRAYWQERASFFAEGFRKFVDESCFEE